MVPVPRLDPSCPWEGLVQAYPPNVKWCEAPLCSWVREPANTWSNLAYVVVGLWLLWRGRREGRLTTVFGAASTVLGVCSGIYHASTNLLTQMLDFVAMYIYAGLPLVLNLRRLGLLGGSLVYPYVLGVVSLTALTPLVHKAGCPIQGIVGLLVLGILLSEAVLARRRTAPRAWFWASLGLLTLGALASVLDVTRLACDPHQHWLQGHAIWHVLTAGALGALSRFYRRVTSESATPQMNLVAGVPSA
ncbi:MAG: ceramidase domain-containing protein [Myxococcales bacterium]|nr:ceramidase [Myxococcota bacterium]MDW8281063.1 ceramidase domain-containing protein [Myxococcales bacterium]